MVMLNSGARPSSVNQVPLGSFGAASAAPDDRPRATSAERYRCLASSLMISLIGAGMRSNPGVAAKLFAALAEAGVNIEMISTSEIRVSVVCRDTDLDVAVRAIHDAFELGGTEEAVVYAGTGR